MSDFQKNNEFPKIIVEREVKKGSFALVAQNNSLNPFSICKDNILIFEVDFPPSNGNIILIKAGLSSEVTIVKYLDTGESCYMIHPDPKKRKPIAISEGDSILATLTQIRYDEKRV